MNKPSKKKLTLVSLLIAAVLAVASIVSFGILKDKTPYNSNPGSSTEKLYDNNMPGVVTVKFKSEYRNDKQLLEDIVKSAGGKIQYYDYDGFIDEGTYDILVNEGTEKSTIAYLKTRTEVEYAIRTLGGSVN